MKAYSMDLRERILAACDGGMKTKEASEKFSVSPAFVRRLKQRRRETGEIEPRRGKPGRKPKLVEKQQQLQELVKEQPDATLEELRDRIDEKVCLSTIWRTLKKMGITLKKSSSCS